jgi:hypothetical protein
MLTADDLLAGSALAHTVEIPAGLLAHEGEEAPQVRLRPLTVRDVQLASKAARDDDQLLSLLLLKAGLAEPALSLEQLQGMHAGLARFLVQEVNRVSGLSVDDDTLSTAVQSPLARASFVLAREFGWSPEQVGELTVGQLLLYLEMLEGGRVPAATA